MKPNLLKTKLIAVFIISCRFGASAQPAYRIEAQIPNYKSGEAILAHQFAQYRYPKDTAHIDANGKMVFEGAKALAGGIYEIITPDRRFTVRLIIDNQQFFSVMSDTTDWVAKTKVKNNRDTEIFYDFQRFMKTQEDEAAALRAQKPKDLEKKFSALQDKRKAFYDNFMKDNASTFTVKLLKTASEPELPTAPKLPNGKSDSLWLYNYYKNHFWDNYDFADERLLRTPFLQQKLQRYMNDLTVQIPDSLIKEADMLIGKAQKGGDKDVLRYTIQTLTQMAEESKILGTEPFKMHLVEKYYFTGIMPISDSSSLKTIKDNFAILKPLLVGKTLPDLGVKGMKTQWVHIHDLNKEYNVVMFYSTSCGHCKEAAPKLKKFHDKWKDLGAEVMTITTEGTVEDWKKFIKEYQWENLFNGYGLEVTRGVDYRKDYDVSSTPTIYILDKTHKIIARRLSVEDLEPFLLSYKRMMLAKANEKTKK